MTNEKLKLLRIFLGESDKIGHTPAYEKIVLEAKENNIAGATVLKGIMGFGKNSFIHTSKLLRLSEDLPIVIEIIDDENKIRGFIERLNEILKDQKFGGIITLENIEILKLS